MDDFAREMQELAAAAEKQGSRSDPGQSVQGALRPVSLGLEALGRAVSENNRLLVKLASELSEKDEARTGDPGDDRIARAVEWVQSHLHKQSQVDAVNQKLFDAMHGELKSYKDAFMFDALHKPFVKDLITLADDLTSIQRQTSDRFGHLSSKATEEKAFLSRLQTNLENTLAHFHEIFGRLDVAAFESTPGTPLDRQRHRAIGVEPAEEPAEDGTLLRSLKPGYMWRERVLRAEDVITRKWTAPKAESNLGVEASLVPQGTENSAA